MYYEDFPVGFQFETATRQLSLADMVGFAQLWDPQPFHVDEVAAQKYFAPRSVVACTVERERCIDCYRETGDGTRQYALHCHGVVQQYAACAAAEKMRLVGKSASASTSSSK